MSTTEPTSLLAYFAAHAPNQPESWFEPAMDHLLFPAAPEETLAVKQAKEAEEEDNLNWMPGREPNIHPEARAILDAHATALEAWEKDVERIKAERAKYRYFAWRWYYAEQMVKANPNTPWDGAL
ncbi:hypothetical protein [Azohydromonas aeria]|uniref:hypothetical protein n=1 Tax=Azohydromonas aeria TaxID=2590212 RepID=UPI0012F88C8A|nr:hypothetical protein [Azohydromonas aeria]